MTESLKKTEDGWICTNCHNPLDQCDHYHGEWQCQECKEWTYPMYYDIEDGCQHCGSDLVKLENFKIGEDMDAGAIRLLIDEAVAISKRYKEVLDPKQGVRSIENQERLNREFPQKADRIVDHAVDAMKMAAISGVGDWKVGARLPKSWYRAKKKPYRRTATSYRRTMCRVRN